jgi:hypothetical protein
MDRFFAGRRPSAAWGDQNKKIPRPGLPHLIPFDLGNSPKMADTTTGLKMRPSGERMVC